MLYASTALTTVLFAPPPAAAAGKAASSGPAGDARPADAIARYREIVRYAV